MSPEVYSRRSLDDELDELLPLASAIALEGPKGVGKTRTALRRSDAAWFLDDESHRALVSADPTFAAAPPGTLLIDEWQRLPSVWARCVDASTRGHRQADSCCRGARLPSAAPSFTAGRAASCRSG